MKQSVWVEDRTRPGTYSIRYYDPLTGVKKRIKANSKDEMKVKVNELEAMLLAYKPGSGAPHATPLVVFEEYLTALVNDEEEPRRPGTISIKRQSLTKFLASMFHMRELTTEKIKSWRTALMKANKPDTVSIRLRDLRAFIVWATKKGILASNPFVGISIPKSSFKGRRLTIEELEALYANMADPLRSFVTVALETGARLGEILGAEWSEIDRYGGSWSIPAAKCKTRIDRLIPLSANAMLVLNKMYHPLNHRVFMGTDRWTIQRHWKRALRDSGISGRVRIHDLRHTFASNFGGRRGSLKAICGWTTDIMANRYSHVELNELREDMAKNNLGLKLGQFGAKSENPT